MRAKKVDLNHGEIADVFKAMGATVHSLHEVGKGCPDLLVGWRGHNLLVEVKGLGEHLNAGQKSWHASWKGWAHLIRTPDEAIALLRSIKQR